MGCWSKEDHLDFTAIIGYIVSSRQPKLHSKIPSQKRVGGIKRNGEMGLPQPLGKTRVSTWVFHPLSPSECWVWHLFRVILENWCFSFEAASEGKRRANRYALLFPSPWPLQYFVCWLVFRYHLSNSLSCPEWVQTFDPHALESQSAGIMCHHTFFLMLAEDWAYGALCMLRTCCTSELHHLTPPNFLWSF